MDLPAIQIHLSFIAAADQHLQAVLVGFGPNVTDGVSNTPRASASEDRDEIDYVIRQRYLLPGQWFIQKDFGFSSPWVQVGLSLELLDLQRLRPTLPSG